MYKIKKALLGKVTSCVLAGMLFLSVFGLPVSAAAPSDAGTYAVDATLSCYVNAMGGVEFSNGYGLLTGTTVTIARDGSAKATLKLGTTSGLSVYGVACTAFIGTDEAPGYYKNGTVTTEGVTYNVSSKTAANASGTVNYIDSITFPVDTNTEKYTMWLYLDSNVMGCQLGDGSGSGASNTPGVATKHTATFTIDWDSAEKTTGAEDEKEATETTSQSAKVEYTVEGGYEVEIPATITVNASTKEGNYSVTAKNFVIPEEAYVTVTAGTAGKLANGSDELTFTNTLESKKLTKDGDKLTGTVKVSDSASNPGKYTGTINFTINYYEGE